MAASARRYFAPALAVCVLLAACAQDSSPVGPAPAVPRAASPDPVPAALGVATRCLGPFRAGAYVPLACFVLVEDGTSPPSTDTRAFADLRIFGGRAQSGIPSCPACGFPPRTFDLDLHIPTDMTPGVKTFTVWATDTEGRRGETTASFEVIAR